MTVIEVIGKRQLEVANDDLQPDRAAEILKELSALIGNINDEIRMRDFEYNKVLLHEYDLEEKANRAKIKAETSDEYLAKRKAKDTKELTIEMIRSLKYFLKSKEEEMQASRYQ